MLVAFIKDNRIEKIGSMPKWYDDDGNQLSIAQLRPHGVLPVEDEIPEYDSLKQVLHKDPQEDWEILSDKVRVTYTITNLSEEEIQKRLIEYLADVRWRVESSGVDINGVMIATDEKSQNRILAARVAADQDPNFVVNWKGANGRFETLDAPTIIAISDVVLEHVNSLFTLESEVQADILSGEITTREQIDSIFYRESE